MNEENLDFSWLDQITGDRRYPDRNLLNDLKPDTRLFHVLRLGAFLDLISKRELKLRKPRCWKDPFEDFLSRTTVVRNGVETTFGDLTKDFFGQCWSLIEESDGLWRNQCPQLESAVRIETTAAKLIRAVWDGTDNCTPLRRFVGQVRYVTDCELKAELVGCLEYGHPLTDDSNIGVVQTLLVKRTQFDYEQEVRLLAEDPAQDSTLKSFPIDPLNLIDSVKFAPKMNPVICEILTVWLAGKEFARPKISRSTLYDPWTLVIHDR